MWDAVKKAIEDNERFLLCTHRDPDADGVGAEMALHEALVRLGKKPVILNPDRLPHILRFLDPQGLVSSFEGLGPETSARMLDETDVIFFLDAGVWKRLQPMDQAVRERVGKLLCIDHHPADKPLTEGSVVTESASSTGELIYDLLGEIGLPLNDRMAYCLYCAIVKDTGCFRFENTGTRVFEIVTELSRFDSVRPHEAYDALFERSSISGVRCLGLVLDTLDFAYGDRLAHIHLTGRMLEKTGAKMEETDNFVNVIRSIDPVQACLFFREVPGGKVKISFRSKSSQIDINLLAEKFGGGGHKRASGALVEGTLSEVIDRVVKEAKECFD